MESELKAFVANSTFTASVGCKASKYTYLFLSSHVVPPFWHEIPFPPSLLDGTWQQGFVASLKPMCNEHSDFLLVRLIKHIRCRKYKTVVTYFYHIKQGP